VEPDTPKIEQEKEKTPQAITGEAKALEIQKSPQPRSAVFPVLFVAAALLFAGALFFSLQTQHEEPVAVFPEAKQPLSTTSWLTYENSEYGFKIQYPSNLSLEVKSENFNFFFFYPFFLMSAIPYVGDNPAINDQDILQGNLPYVGKQSSVPPKNVFVSGRKWVVIRVGLEGQTIDRNGCLYTDQWFWDDKERHILYRIGDYPAVLCVKNDKEQSEYEKVLQTVIGTFDIIPIVKPDRPSRSELYQRFNKALEDKNNEEALKIAEQTITIYKSDINMFFQMGVLKYNKGDYTGAISAFNEALSWNPNYADALYYLGSAYKKIGMTNDALKYFERVLTLNPDNQEVISIIQDLKNQPTLKR
jgi:tetratricopeptide (TPR) repeat protein